MKAIEIFNTAALAAIFCLMPEQMADVQQILSNATIPLDKQGGPFGRNVGLNYIF